VNFKSVFSLFLFVFCLCGDLGGWWLGFASFLLIGEISKMADCCEIKGRILDGE
jgi:hypothetical protein